MKLKNYTVSKRFIIWVDTKIAAKDLQEASIKAEELKPMDFAKFDRPMNDWETVVGTSVSEDW